MMSMKTRSKSGSRMSENRAQGSPWPSANLELTETSQRISRPHSQSRSPVYSRAESFKRTDTAKQVEQKAVVTVRSKRLKRPFSQIDRGASENINSDYITRASLLSNRKRSKADWSKSNEQVKEEVSSSSAVDCESKENLKVGKVSRASEEGKLRDIEVIKSDKKIKAKVDQVTVTVVKDEQGNCVRDDDSGSSDEEETENSFDYIQMREANMKANEEFFASLGMDEAKKQLQDSAPSKPVKKYTPTQKGLKVKKEPEILIRRHSLRIRRIDPKGTPLPEPEPVEEAAAEARLPDGPVSMKDCIFSKAENLTEEHVTSFSTLVCSQQSDVKPAKASADSLTNLLNKVSMSEDRVAKVVPGRVFSVTWHPSSSCLLTAAGDKYGHVGLWNVESGEKDLDSVLTFKPHIKPVSHLHFRPGQHKLYSCSYDATLRCGDFEKGVFDEVFSVPEQEDDLLRNFEFIDNDSTMLVSHFSGLVSVVDTRTPRSSAERSYNVSRKSLRTVSAHPINHHYFITAGVEAKINLWDLRNISTKSPKPVQTMSLHTKAISSAYFSPNGGKILSCSSDDTIVVCSVDGGMQVKPYKTIRHCNWTGRWLTNFRPTWHPFVDDIFVTGSMRRPREIEVYSADGKLVKSLQDENFLGSVCSLNEFHPGAECAVVGANSSGRLHVFM